MHKLWGHGWLHRHFVCPIYLYFKCICLMYRNFSACIYEWGPLWWKKAQNTPTRLISSALKSSDRNAVRVRTSFRLLSGIWSNLVPISNKGTGFSMNCSLSYSLHQKKKGALLSDSSQRNILTHMDLLCCKAEQNVPIWDDDSCWRGIFI